MTKAEEYLRWAEEADERAETLRDTEAKQIYHKLAANWCELACLTLDR